MAVPTPRDFRIFSKTVTEQLMKTTEQLGATKEQLFDTKIIRKFESSGPTSHRFPVANGQHTRRHFQFVIKRQPHKSRSRSFRSFRTQDKFKVIMAPPEPSIYDLAYRGKTQAVKILINENPQLKTDVDGNQRMLIHWAALGGHDELVTYLLSLGLPTDPKDDMGMTPLILAASGGRERVVKLLINQGANFDAKTNDEHSALQYAASKNWKSICAMLLEKEADINISDAQGSTPLHRSACKGNVAIVKLLLEHGKRLKIDQRDAYGNTALHLACEEDRQEEAKLLVANGASIEITNKERKTPLDLCNLILAKQLKEIYDKNVPI